MHHPLMHTVENPTQVPPVCANTVEAFWEINKGRQGTGYGPGPLLYTELRAYCQLMDEKLEPWEIRLFRRLDNAYLEEVASKMKEET
jgi:hypothetical protein